MTYGPAMAAKIFDTPTTPTEPPTAPPPVPARAAAVSSQAVLDKLDRILAVLEANRAQAGLPKV